MADAHEFDPPRDPEDLEREAVEVLRGRLGEDGHLLEVLRFGVEMEEFISSSKVGQYLVNKANEDLQAAIGQLLDLPTIEGEDARNAHAEARLAFRLLQYIENAVIAGQESEQQIIARGEIEGDQE